MMLLNTIKKELNILGIKPKKSLGQNFLVNEGVYKKIVAALEIKKDDAIIEVGPGLGTLTGYLAESGAKIIAIEKDEKFAAYLKNKFFNRKNVKIVEGDILKFNPLNYSLLSTHYKLVGNIPYYLTSHLIRIIFEEWPHPEKIMLMLQKEVAQRIIAKPPNMSLLAVSVQYYAEPKIISYVSAGSFYPPPEVDSAITKFSEFKERDKGFSNDLFKIAKAGFSGKRKQLLNSLSGGLKKSREEIGEKLKLSNIDPKRRAETLTIDEWIGITKNFFPNHG